jgi:hypothetical protein
MPHLSPFDGLLGFATLHPVLTAAPVLVAVVAVVAASRRPPRRVSGLNERSAAAHTD